MIVQGVSEKVAHIKLFWNIFIPVKSFLREILQICWQFIST